MSDQHVTPPPRFTLVPTCAHCQMELYQREGDTTWYHKSSGLWKCTELFAAPKFTYALVEKPPTRICIEWPPKDDRWWFPQNRIGNIEYLAAAPIKAALAKCEETGISVDTVLRIVTMSKLHWDALVASVKGKK